MTGTGSDACTQGWGSETYGAALLLPQVAFLGLCGTRRVFDYPYEDRQSTVLLFLQWEMRKVN
jgi:hypothetical protein